MSESQIFPELTIGITTRNRQEDLRRSLRSCLRQSGRIEVVVVDDGSTDGTSELVRCEFPGVVLYRFESSAGLVVRRNFLAKVAKAPFLLSMDDDAEFSGTEIVSAARSGFDDPRVGALALPYIDTRHDPALLKQAVPSGAGPFVVASYRGTAHAVRRDTFLALGGYREFIHHQGEEPDFCIRMLDAGYVVAGFSADPILHHESPKRDFARVDVFGRRNDVLFAWWNVPLPYLPIHLAGTVLNGLAFGLRHRRLGVMLRGLWRGMADMRVPGVARRPVSGQTYRLHRILKKRGPVALTSIEHLLPARMGR